MAIIPDEALRLGDVPPPDADWEEICQFAHTFDGYEYWGSFKRCVEIANQRLDSTLAELRTSLFFAFRAQRHGGEVDP
jgi:hypothetical protein